MGEQVVARTHGGVAQLGEHLPCKQGVKSSNLSVSTRPRKRGWKLYLENRILKNLKSINTKSKILLVQKSDIEDIRG